MGTEDEAEADMGKLALFETVKGGGGGRVGIGEGDETVDGDITDGLEDRYS